MDLRPLPRFADREPGQLLRKSLRHSRLPGSAEFSLRASPVGLKVSSEAGKIGHQIAEFGARKSVRVHRHHALAELLFEFPKVGLTERVQLARISYLDRER